MTIHRSKIPNGHGLPEDDLRCIVLRYQRRITVFATRMLGGDEAAAQDVAQETFLALWRNHIREDGKREIHAGGRYDYGIGSLVSGLKARSAAMTAAGRAFFGAYRNLLAS